MKITSIDCYLLELPLKRPVAAAITRGSALKTIFMPVAEVETDAGVRGLGYAWSLGGGGRAMLTVLKEDLAPALIGRDPRDHQGIWQALYWKAQGYGRHGLVIQAQSAIDLALWDIKGKAAGMPLYKLLGGTRDAAPAYGSDGGWMNMEVEEIIAAARDYLDQGMRGVKLKVGHDDPQIDWQRVKAIREALGPDVWIAVDANQKWDYATALAMGRRFEQFQCAWYEEPMLCEDVEGHARLAEKLDIPIALGETLASSWEIGHFLRTDAVQIVQPDITRVGGITEFVKIAAICSGKNLIVEPHLMMEASVHLACSLPGVAGLEYMPWLTSAFADPPRLVDGCLEAPQAPGLGLEIAPAVKEKCRIA